MFSQADQGAPEPGRGGTGQGGQCGGYDLDFGVTQIYIGLRPVNRITDYMALTVFLHSLSLDFLIHTIGIRIASTS